MGKKRKQNIVHALSKEKMEAIRLSIEGLTCDQIGPIVGVTGRTVRRWMNEPEVIEEYRHVIRSYRFPEVAKAHRNLMKDLDNNSEKEPYIRQNATFYALNKFAADVLGESDGSCTITFVNGVPDIGMPEDDGEEDEE